MNIIDEQINLTLKNFIFENMTNEANNNLPIHEFDNDMKKLGFIKDYDRAGSRVIYKLKDGGLKITTHYPGKTAKADMLRNVFDNLIKIKWFDDPNNFNIFPFDRWGFNPNSINIDTTKQDILKANEIYQNAEVYRVFYNTPNKLCVLHTNEGYNLCRDINDKRPLLDKWYNGFEQGNVPKLKLDNYETMETEVYPINQDGTLDTKNITLENKKLNIMSKKLIRLTEGDLHRIIKESVKNILKETRLDYDVDNFSGRNYINNQYDEYPYDDETFLDSPYDKGEITSELMDYASLTDDYRSKKEIENDYSWDLFNNKPIAHGVDGYYKVNRKGVKNDIDRAFNKRMK